MSKPVKRILVVVILLVVLGALALPKLVSSDDGRSAQAPGPAAREPLGVSAYVIQPDQLRNQIHTTGTLLANESVDLTSESSGKVTQILFREGSYVKEGQLLLKINDAELQAQLERARFRIRLAEERESRQRQILEKGGISQEEYDQVLTELNVLRAEVQLVEAQIDKAEIRAPFSGVIGLRYVSEGSYISPQTRIATLQSLNPLKVDFSLPEKYAGVVQVGREITFRVEGLPQTFQGEVYAIEPKITQDTRTLQLRARTPNPDGTLVPGAFANVNLTLETIDDALMVPAIAIVPELEGRKVFVYQGGKAVERRVETGTRTETMVQVIDGLAPGDTVITSGLQQVRAGLPVRLGDVNG